MIADAAWKNVLSQPQEHGHIVQTYKSDAFLVSAVSIYLGKALNRDEAVIVIATPEHWKSFESRLLLNNIDIEQALAQHRLINLNAAETLSKFMVGGMPDWNLFCETVGKVVDQISSGLFRPVRAYGEMVNLLWTQGNAHAAIRLEEMWNDLGKLKTFSLFCAYTTGSIDKKSYSGVLGQVFDMHSHVVPGEDYLRFEEALTKAFIELVEPDKKALHALFDAYKRQAIHRPDIQSIMRWLREHIPHMAERVIDQATLSYTPDELRATA